MEDEIVEEKENLEEKENSKVMVKEDSELQPGISEQTPEVLLPPESIESDTSPEPDTEFEGVEKVSDIPKGKEKQYGI